MTTQLEDLVGAKLVVGIPGTKATPEIIKHLKDIHAGGIIFYRINFESPAQLRKLITDLENGLGRKLLVCVDHEGGRVIMYRDGITVFPDNLTLGTAADVELVRKQGEIAAKELRALGTDVNFSPVLDVLTPSYSPNIGIRSYGEDFRKVGELGAAYITALQAGGVSATAKHFPGKGHAPVDAHLKLPTINSSWDEMKAVHLQPFLRAIEAGVDCVMSSHPRYPKLDPNPENIATFSRSIITDYLRKELNYKGLIVSDDLEMGAVKELCGTGSAAIGTAAVRTVQAGHDLVLSCHSFDDQRGVYRGLMEAYKSKTLSVKELEESVDRIQKLKAKRAMRFSGEPSAQPIGQKFAEEAAKKGVVIVQDAEHLLPLSDKLSQDLGVIFPQLSSFASKIMVEKEFEDEIAYFHHHLGDYPGNHVTEIYKIEPDEEDIETAANLARRSNVTLFFCFDAHLYPKQQGLLAELQKSARKLIVVLMRDPYDKSFLRPKDVGITAFGWRKCQIEAVISRVFGE
jgi:beta-N-acetylhexosaminidase